ncbi:NADH:flavin oxidoreductase [Sphingopyxis sp. OPL5]|uniref:NADH:flavin oxidoreductase n=1 Tax=Sphingopyxis sp. OPL5 TaxID=2486273 RepID=UPI00223B70D3|nr:NADH:flavin oxidoreductase [Sphingopyxis sp. OPL5]
MPDRLFEPLSLSRGPAIQNRFMLAPLTNRQSHADGRLSDAEHKWLEMRAAGGFGLTMTAAAHVQPVGQGFTGQLGVFDEEHVAGLTALATAIRAKGSLSSVQLHHAGSRAETALVGAPVAPSAVPDRGVRALTEAEVAALRDDFIAGAVRADRAGFDGVEIHGAHGYILAEFLSAASNSRSDDYGGSLENRARILFEIVDGIRAATRPDFQLGLRLSPERFGLVLEEIRDLAVEVMAGGKIDYLDMSLWDARKEPEDDRLKGRSLLSYFAELPRGDVRLGAAGKVMTAEDARDMLDAGCDFVVIGRAAILRHDFPERVRRDPAYRSPPLPASVPHLLGEGLSDEFVHYMRRWPGFVEEEAAG